mmetsp:Transcript_26803/g.67232  ORF Transcript_26803/g.67232 Transcript_26803/m.67232 type:complete len:394 (-) Transcript_26803:483-1664(-)
MLLVVVVGDAASDDDEEQHDVDDAGGGEQEARLLDLPGPSQALLCEAKLDVVHEEHRERDEDVRLALLLADHADDERGGGAGLEEHAVLRDGARPVLVDACDEDGGVGDCECDVVDFEGLRLVGGLVLEVEGLAGGVGSDGVVCGGVEVLEEVEVGDVVLCGDVALGEDVGEAEFRADGEVCVDDGLVFFEGLVVGDGALLCPGGGEVVHGGEGDGDGDLGFAVLFAVVEHVDIRRVRINNAPKRGAADLEIDDAGVRGDDLGLAKLVLRARLQHLDVERGGRLRGGDEDGLVGLECDLVHDFFVLVAELDLCVVAAGGAFLDPGEFEGGLFGDGEGEGEGLRRVLCVCGAVVEDGEDAVVDVEVEVEDGGLGGAAGGDGDGGGLEVVLCGAV